MTATASRGRRWRAAWAEFLPSEYRASVAWATAWFFCLLFGYYQLRPLRETKGFASGADELPWLFLASFLTMVVAVPVYGAVAARLRRERLVQVVYQFFALNLVAFFFAMRWTEGASAVWVGRVFFVWLSVFNQFVVSLMWSVLADAYQSGQAKRWFGFISAGGTLGGIMGSVIANQLSKMLDITFVFGAGFVMLELCVLCCARFIKVMPVTEKTTSPDKTNHATKKASRHAAWKGVVAIATSPYLMGIFFFLLAIKACATTVYMEQAEIIRAAQLSESARYQLLSHINTAVLVLTLLVQVFGTASLLNRLGLAFTLLIFPAVYVFGFTALALAPTLAVIVILEVAHRAASYAVVAPAIEVLFTVVDRKSLYQAKSVLDTVVIRGGDVISAQGFQLMRWAEISLTGIAWIGLPVAVMSCLLGAWVGRHQEMRQGSNPDPSPSLA